MANEIPQPNVAVMFKALGDPTRLRIFEFLRRCSGPVAVGDGGEVRRVTAGQETYPATPSLKGRGVRNIGQETSPQPSPWKGEGVGSVGLPMVAGSAVANGTGVDIPRLSPDGLTVGEICCRVTGEDRISSAISFHLKELRLAGLIQMERRGKNMICSINQDALVTLADYFVTAPVEPDCC